MYNYVPRSRYVERSGDFGRLNAHAIGVVNKVEAAGKTAAVNPATMALFFIGWDERVRCQGQTTGFGTAEATRVFRALTVRTAKAAAAAIRSHDLSPELAARCDAVAATITTLVRHSPEWCEEWGVHGAAEAILANLTTAVEADQLFTKVMNDSARACSLSPFNSWFILQALSKLGRHDFALAYVRVR